MEQSRIKMQSVQGPGGIASRGAEAMSLRKHALSLFTKLPQPGTTKTHLTMKYGGPLTEEGAANLYQAMMLDVATVGFKALEMCRQTTTEGTDAEEYHFFISCTPDSARPVLQEIFEAELPDANDIMYIIDKGRNFDEHFNDHYRQIFDHGYYSVVCIGGDLPLIYPEFISRAFQWLFSLGAKSDRGAMVIAPCQAAGVSLVGLTAEAPVDFTGAFYNPQGISALEAITNIAREKHVPTALLEPLSDVDNQEDLAHTMAVINTMAYASDFQSEICVPRRTLSWLQQSGLTVYTPPDEGSKGVVDDQD
jgi:glycosyltransferase A (GT-A) superfamily protein (DUF2064 family)